jgi:predicted N-acyltransferase
MKPRRFDRIARINAARWDRAVSGVPFSSHAWLSYGERIHAADRPVYQITDREGLHEMACVCWVRRREQLPISAGIIRSLLERFLIRRPLVTCQTAVAGLSGLFTGSEPGYSGSGLSGLAAGMIDVLEEARGSFLIVPYLDLRTASNPGWGAGFLSVVMSPSTVLSIRWSTFTEYLAGLQQSVRKDYRRKRNQAKRLGLRTHLRLEPPEPGRAHALIRSVERKHRAAPLPHLDALITARPVPGGKWIVVEREGETVGCGLILRDRRWLVLTALGIADDSPNVYFELMFEAIAHAIESGAAGVFGGGGAYDFKRRLGFLPTEETRVLFYARNPRLRRLGAWLAARETQTADRTLRLETLTPPALPG